MSSAARPVRRVRSSVLSSAEVNVKRKGDRPTQPASPRSSAAAPIRRSRPTRSPPAPSALGPATARPARAAPGKLRVASRRESTVVNSSAGSVGQPVWGEYPGNSRTQRPRGSSPRLRPRTRVGPELLRTAGREGAAAEFRRHTRHSRSRFHRRGRPVCRCHRHPRCLRTEVPGS